AYYGFTQRFFKCLNIYFFARQILIQKFFVILCYFLNQFGPVLLGLGLVIFGYILLFNNLAHLILINAGLHIKEINNTLEIRFRANRQLDGYSIWTQAILNGSNVSIKICSHSI